MGPVVLRVDVPDKGFAGPQGSNQRVFPAHKIQVAASQQRVKVRLRHGWQVVHPQRAQLEVCAGYGAVLWGRQIGLPGRAQRSLQGPCRAARSDQQQGRSRRRYPRRQRLRKPCGLIAKQADQAFAGPADCACFQPLPARRIRRCRHISTRPGLAQQPACAGAKSGVVKMFHPALCRPLHDGRRKAMAAFHIGLRAQVLEVDPHRIFWVFMVVRPRRISASSYEFRSNFAAESFYPHVRRRQ